MSKLDLGNLGGYVFLTKWYWYQSRMDDLGDEGWKLHVSGDEGNAQKILDLVLPKLKEGKYAHKVLPDLEAIQKQVGEQIGKFFCIYPRNILEAFIIVYEIDQVLGATVGRNDSPKILNDRPVGTTVVYTRYGAFNDLIKHPTEDRYLLDTRGQIKPDWIEDPWNLYPQIDKLNTFAPWPKHSQKGARGKANCHQVRL